MIVWEDRRPREVTLYGYVNDRMKYIVVNEILGISKEQIIADVKMDIGWLNLDIPVN